MKAEDVVKKGKPEIDPPEGCHWRRCSKCSGTGVFAKGVRNGALVSNTGFVCYSCDGRGWVSASKPIARTKGTKGTETIVIPF